MLDFFSQYPLYSVLVIVLICWFGIATYLMRLNRKVRQLENLLS